MCPHRVYLIAGRQDGQVRMMDGRSDPGGAWQYGRLEVIIKGVWSTIVDRRLRRESLGRRGAQVACRALGFATGGQLIVGESSPFPAPGTATSLDGDASCNGSEMRLTDCDLSFREDDGNDYGAGVLAGTVALLCTTPSGARGGLVPTDPYPHECICHPHKLHQNLE